MLELLSLGLFARSIGSSLTDYLPGWPEVFQVGYEVLHFFT
jgi:hypothetical protein